MKFFFLRCAGIYLFSLFYSIAVFATAPTPLQAIFKLNQNYPNQTFSATLTLKNNSSVPVRHWQLAFTFIRPILELKEGTITKKISYFYIISPKDALQIIAPHSQFVFHLLGQYYIHNISDAPAGYFLITTPPLSRSQSTSPIQAQTILPTWEPAIGQDEYSINIKKNQTSIEGNPITPKITPDQSLIIPIPVSLTRTPGNFTLQQDTTILIDKNANNAINAAHFFEKSIAPATGYTLKTKLRSVNQIPMNTLLFTQKWFEPKLGAEGYILKVTPQHIVISSHTEAGFFYAIQSLRQLLPPAIFSNKRSNNVIWKIPALTIQDYPRFGYRGLLLDSARHFIPVDQVKRLIDLMALHKLNRLQWHLTDDEGWRVEIKKYPALTSIGAWRGFNLPIPPSFGSGAKPYGGYYTQAQIRDIVNYAKERQITIIPEIDMPGHARALLMSLPKLLVDPKDKSQYSSAQHYHDNVLSPCLENTFTMINNVMTEIAALFPGNTIHTGADEIPVGAWMGSPACQQLMKSLGLKTQDDLQHYFLTRVEKIVQSKHKKMAVWNDAIQKENLDHSTQIYSWTDEKAAFNAAKQGYPVILTNKYYLYFDLAYNPEPAETGLYWAGFVDTFQAYSYQPINPSWPSNISQQILGVQGALWSEMIPSQEKLDYVAFPKVLALAEVAWSPKNRRNWIDFSERVGRYHFPRLDNYDVAYRISPPGINLLLLSKKILDANIEFPGLVLRYTTDGTSPNSNAPIYNKPTPIKTSTIKMRAFNSKNRGSRDASISAAPAAIVLKKAHPQ